MPAFTPFSEDDRLETIAGTERLRLADGVLLTADHFQTEQLYHRARLARLLAYLQGAGTVAGLDVSWRTGDDPLATELVVTPGLAVDYRGRFLELGHEACITIADWVADLAATGAGAALIANGDRAAGGGLPRHMMTDLFADFRAYARRPEPAFATGNADQIDGVQATLSDDAVHLHLVVRDAADDRVPMSMIGRLVPDTIPSDMIEETIQVMKRQRLWAQLQPRPETIAPDSDLETTEHDPSQQDFGGVFLARLALPLREVSGVLEFDDTVDMTPIGDPDTNPVAPDFSNRMYSYSAAELALLHGLRR